MTEHRIRVEIAAMKAELATRASIDPEGLSAVIDLAAVGLTHLLWWQTCVADWHTQGRFSDEDLFRLNSLTTSIVRGMAREWHQSEPLNGAARLESLTNMRLGGDVLRDLAQVAVFWLTTPSRPLAIGVDLDELAGSDMEGFGDQVVAAAEKWCGDADYEGADHGLIKMALHAVTQPCNTWWGTPRWREMVNSFMNALADRSHPHWGQAGELWPVLEPTADATDRPRLRAMLLVSPWDLDPLSVRWILQAGLGRMR